MIARLIELLRDAFTRLPHSRHQAWVEIWKRRTEDGQGN